MDESAQRTPGELMGGRPIEPWGPPIDAPATDPAIELLRERLSPREPASAVAERLRQWTERYVLLRRISVTGGGAVYEALDRALDRLVAIKVYRNLACRDALERARAEAHVTALAHSPYVITVHDHASWADLAYTVIELCDMDLRAWCPNRPWREIVSRILEAGQGLAQVHRAGYVHNDIKPTNILIRGKVAKLADFGIAATEFPRRKFQGGTPGYAPASACQHGPTRPDDIYALAVTTWFCLFGAMPFDRPPKLADTTAGFAHYMVKAHNREFVEPTLPRDMPRSIVRLLQRAMSSERSKRPSLGEFLRDLKWIRDQPVTWWQWATAAAFPGGRPTIANVVMLTVLMFTGAWGGFTCAPKPESSILEVYMDLQEPLLRAEIAAKMGDGKAAIAELTELYVKARAGAVAPEMQRITDAAMRIADSLKAGGDANGARIADEIASNLERFTTDPPQNM